MSDNIPFEIQMEIIKRVSSVKSLVQFRSVSKTWKSFIDSSKFIKGYGARHTQPHSRILSYRCDYLLDELRYICLVDDDIETFKVQQQEFVVSPLLKQYHVGYVVGACHGLLCLYCYSRNKKLWMFVIWNPSIRKSFGIYNRSEIHLWNQANFGFGVCPVTRDPIVVKIFQSYLKPWHVEVFTLSLGVWNVIPTANLPRQSIKLSNQLTLNIQSTHVVIDRFIYWGAFEKTINNDGQSTTNHMVVSFDLITKEFKVINLPDTLTNELCRPVSVSKLRGSLVVYGSIYVMGANVMGAECCGVWVMEHDLSFRKLFATSIPYNRILGFKKSGKTIFETPNEGGIFTTPNVYDPCTQQFNNLGISGVSGSFFMGSYKESLLLLHHSDLHIYCDDNQ